MATYQYTIQVEGRRRNGTLEADSEQAAAAILRSQGGLILALRTAETGRAVQVPGATPLKAAHRRWEALLIRKQGIEEMLRQLATLLRGGVPILTALTSMAEVATPLLSRALVRTGQAIREGQSFSRALSTHLPGINPVTVGLLSVGEANGTLDAMVLHAANLMERSRKTRERILQAFAYPVFVAVVAMGVGYYMVRHVFPVVMKFIAQGRRVAVLPLPTRIVIGMNDVLTAYGIYILLAPFALAGLVALLRRSPSTGEKIDALALRIPLLGGAFRFHANAMWSLTLGSMLSGGLDILAAVTLVEGTMSNERYAAQFRQIKTRLRDGVSLSRAIGESSLRSLCPMAHAMIAVSETGGSLDDSLLHVARFSEEQLERRTTLLGKLVEPAVFIVVGGFVGIVYFGFFMAILTATSAAR
jgi:type II secretory pathway component PulF